MGFPRQEYWSKLSFPSAEDLPNSGTEHGSPSSPALAGEFFITKSFGKPYIYTYKRVCMLIYICVLVQYSPSHLSKGRFTIRVIVLAQAAIQYHKPSGSNNRNLFLTVLEAG